MSYNYPVDPRPKWEWCPKCEAWYELTPDNYYRVARPVPGTCIHDEDERRLSEEEVRAACRPADVILSDTKILKMIEEDGKDDDIASYGAP